MKWIAMTATGAVCNHSQQGVATENRIVICPDMLRLEQLGMADNARGRFVRGSFWLLDLVWKVP